MKSVYRIISTIFAIVFAVSLILVLSACGKGLKTPDVTTDGTKQAQIDTGESSNDTSTPPVSDEKKTEPETKPETEPKTEPETTGTDAAPVTDYVPSGKTDPSAFDNCLFIGDSRTIGLRDYGNLGKADVFATIGMNSFRVLSERVNVPGVGNTTLDGLLSSRKYAKIYFMLGLNEIGYDTNSVIKKYGTVIEHLSTVCPDSKIVLCANLHIKNSRSSSDPVYNNTVLNKLNDGLKALANGKSIVYLDVNPLFDDANGALRADYTVDDFHLIGKYYDQWCAWLAENS